MKSDENVIAANAVAAVIWRAFGAIINQAMHGYLRILNIGTNLSCLAKWRSHLQDATSLVQTDKAKEPFIPSACRVLRSADKSISGFWRGRINIPMSR